MGRGSVGVGGCGDHGLTGSSAHVHLLTMTQVAVPISGVVGSVAQVAGSVVGSMSGSVVGSMMGRGSVGVGWCGDHGLTGSSAHVHLLTMTQVAVTVSGVMGSVAQVVGSVVGSMGGSVVGSMMGRGSVGVGGCGDHGLTGNSA